MLIETSSVWYRFEHVSTATLASAVERAVKDETTFSVLNTEGAALVVPWSKVRSVSAADVFEEVVVPEDSEADLDDLRTWTCVWEGHGAPTAEPAKVFSA